MSIEAEIEAQIETRLSPLREEIGRLRGELSARAESARDGELESLRAAIARLETEAQTLRDAHQVLADETAEAIREETAKEEETAEEEEAIAEEETAEEEEAAEEEEKEEEAGVTLIEAPPIEPEPAAADEPRRRSFFTL